MEITGILIGAALSKMLREVGRLTIPYLVVYSQSGKEIFSSDAYSVEQLLHSIEVAQASSQIQP